MAWKLGDKLDYQKPKEGCGGPCFIIFCTNCGGTLLVCKECVRKGVEPVCACQDKP